MRRAAMAICLLLSVLVMGTVPARAQSFVWAKRLGGTEFDLGVGLTVDASRNVYTVGYFQGTSDFDPGPGIFNLTTDGSDVFVSKLDSAGNFVWARQLGGGTANAASVAVDVNGSVYTVGYFEGTSDFDPGPAVFNLTAAGSDVFVSKLDSAGNFVWAKRLGGTGAETIAYDVVLDGSGNVHTVGRFIGTTDFDPGLATFTIASTTNMGTPTDDGFVSKLDSAGNFVWAKRLGGAGFDEPRAVALDTNGNVYTVGHFQNSTADFDPGPGVFNLTPAGADGFISKLDGTGSFVWAKRLGGSMSDFAVDVAIGPVGSVHTVGFFQGTADFDPGAGTFNVTSFGRQDAFISKLDSAGNFVWARRLGGTLEDTAWGVAVAPAGNIYAVGGFAGTADFDPGPGTHTLVSAGSEDMFISMLSSDGDFGSAVRAGSTSGDSALQVAYRGDLHVMGYFQGTVDFDPGPGAANLTDAGNYDVFILDLSFASAGAVPDGQVVAGLPLIIHRVPASSDIQLQWSASCSPDDSDYEIYQGPLGSYTSHMPLICSTGGMTTATFNPGSGGLYYLVVPRSASGVEGSYGRNSAGVERPTSTSACLPQSIGCP